MTASNSVVRFFTLGYVNPRQMVAAEVRGALVNASQVLNSSLWWMSVQTTPLAAHPNGPAAAIAA